MMSWSDDLSSLSTLTHELGHSMHSAHTWKTQPGVYSEYSIFVAEVASNFNQAMTRAWLFDHEKDTQFQIALIEEAMENFHRYFFIMPTLARFEREVHRRIEAGEGVTASDLNNLMADLFAEGYGGAVELERDREGSTWAQFSHLYANFYVFQYATGISAAHALAAPILAGDKDAAQRYIDFLSCGSSLYPIDALKKAGIDMTTPAAIEKAFEVLGGLIDRLDFPVIADIYGNYFLFIDEELQGYPVGQVYRNRIARKRTGFKLMQSQGWMIRIQLQKLQGFHVLIFQFGMFFKELLHFFFIGKGENDSIHFLPAPYALRLIPKKRHRSRFLVVPRELPRPVQARAAGCIVQQAGSHTYRNPFDFQIVGGYLSNHTIPLPFNNTINSTKL